MDQNDEATAPRRSTTTTSTTTETATIEEGSLSGIWGAVELGDVLFEGKVLKQSEILGRWNERYVQIVRIRQGVLVCLYWTSEEAREQHAHAPRGLLDASKSMVSTSPESLTIEVRHFSDLLRESDCFGPRRDIVANLRVDSTEVLEKLAGALQGIGGPSGDGTDGAAALQFGNMVTAYSRERALSASGKEKKSQGADKNRNRLDADFALLGELGRGAFSIVYRAKRRKSAPAKNENGHKEDHDELAIKVALLTKLSVRERKTQLRYLNSEVSIMRKVREQLPTNENVVHLLESFAEPRPSYRVCMVLELCNGGELFDRIVERRSFSERDAKDVIRSLARALNELHAIGIVHRDLKPENLIYATSAPDSVLKITDFGLALDMEYPERDVYKSHVVGTSGYFAPEVLSLRYSPACDVWSLGVVLYILLCGYPPFVGRTRVEVQKEIREGRYEFHMPEWKNISLSSRDLITRMLQVNPKRRIRMAQVLEHPWATERSSSDEKPIPLAKHKQFNNRRKLKAAAYAVMWGARLRNKRKETLTALAKRMKPDGFTAQDLELIRSTFDEHTKERGGVIEDAPQLESIMQVLGFQNVPADRIFNLFDDNGDGHVDQAELLSGLAALQGPGEDSLKFCFDVYDRDGSGEIDKDELMSVLSMAITNTSIDTDKFVGDLSEAFDQVDTDRNGAISFEEFKSACQVKPYLVECLLSRRLSGAVKVPSSSSLSLP
ncbi:Protein kinase, putative [Hondaea fermentalgiana]|uniref:Protein kinase, putative n=1 Tax=Hondaea fermentalgiana TaxID=2315210 RepID=A0A2R5G140_9STRA|nr:Protein kinase, putative [Hondaea fermentalgiana]|eukprot:GBG24737.1 Protein kinase, putative [Hondaea fermentalgiana]